MVTAGCSRAADPPRPRGDGDSPRSLTETLLAVRRSDLCVTAGALAERAPPRPGLDLAIDNPGVRATALRPPPKQPGPTVTVRRAELAFVYEGPSRMSEPLANGELRRQIGLKLRAKDTCNVVYVMWQIEPRPGVFVSVKSNPGLSTHEQCGDRGYDNLRSRTELAPATQSSEPSRAPPPATRAGVRHVLVATLGGASFERLTVTADDVLVFDDDLPSVGLSFDGPFGLRSDNGAFRLGLRITDSAAQSTEPAPCR